MRGVMGVGGGEELLHLNSIKVFDNTFQWILAFDAPQGEYEPPKSLNKYHNYKGLLKEFKMLQRR